MFKYISEILKSFTPAQRITALLILVFSIIILTLGPAIINSNTNTCDELTLRVKSQEEQITQLNQRVTELNSQLLLGQRECTDNLIAKQKEIMEIVNGMIVEAESANKSQRKKVMMRRVTYPDFSTTDENGQPTMKVEAAPPPPVYEPVTDNSDMVYKLKQLKNKIQKGIPK